MQIDGEPWFVAADICRALGYANPTEMIKPLDGKDKAKKFLGSGLPANVVSEGGLYLTVLRAQRSNPEARAFQSWVTKVVLPSIRKDGGYIHGEEHVISGAMTEEELIFKARPWRS